eukprot:COSAG05_NODE_2149_length_3474_cov_2.524444_3_plen_138_part_00
MATPLPLPLRQLEHDGVCSGCCRKRSLGPRARHGLACAIPNVATVIPSMCASTCFSKASTENCSWPLRRQSRCTICEVLCSATQLPAARTDGWFAAVPDVRKQAASFARGVAQCFYIGATGPPLPYASAMSALAAVG